MHKASQITIFMICVINNWYCGWWRIQCLSYQLPCIPWDFLYKFWLVNGLPAFSGIRIIPKTCFVSLFSYFLYEIVCSRNQMHLPLTRYNIILFCGLFAGTGSIGSWSRNFPIGNQSSCWLYSWEGPQAWYLFRCWVGWDFKHLLRIFEARK